MQQILKQLTNNANYYTKHANDSHTKQHADGYKECLKDLKMLLRKENKKNEYTFNGKIEYAKGVIYTV